MAYTLACGDVMSGCDATFEADSEDELLAEAGAHAASEHGVTEMTPETMEAVRSAIRTS